MLELLADLPIIKTALNYQLCRKIWEDDASSILGPEECRKRLRDARRSCADIDPRATCIL